MPKTTLTGEDATTSPIRIPITQRSSRYRIHKSPRNSLPSTRQQPPRSHIASHKGTGQLYPPFRPMEGTTNPQPKTKQNPSDIRILPAFQLPADTRLREGSPAKALPSPPSTRAQTHTRSVSNRACQSPFGDIPAKYVPRLPVAELTTIAELSLHHLPIDGQTNGRSPRHCSFTRVRFSGHGPANSQPHYGVAFVIVPTNRPRPDGQPMGTRLGAAAEFYQGKVFRPWPSKLAAPLWLMP